MREPSQRPEPKSACTVPPTPIDEITAAESPATGSLSTGAFQTLDAGKTGQPPSGKQVEEGYALQLGTTGLMVRHGAFGDLQGEPVSFEYWSLAKSPKSETGFGYVTTPILSGSKRTGIPLGDFLPEAQRYLDDALDRWILGDEPFTARLNPDAPAYATYDQLMRLDEWLGRGA